MRRTRLVLSLAGMLVPVFLWGDAFGITPPPTATAAPPATLGHFMAYGVKPSKGTASFVPLGPVSLPRLGGGPYNLLKVGSLLLPANKNGEGTREPATHLLEYRLKTSKGRPKFPGMAGVRVTNQCSDVVVELAKPVAVLVPTAKDLTGPVTAPANPPVDHLLCFDAKLQKKGPGGVALPKFPKGVQVQVADQFQSRRYELTSVTRLCVPTAKSGSPFFLKGADKGKPAALAPAIVQHADEHLLCYKAKLATTEVPQRGCGPATPGVKGPKIPKQPAHTPLIGVFVANQLGTLRLDSTKEVELCMPSLAELPGGGGGGGLSALPGDPAALVSAATFDLSQFPGWTDAEITVDAIGSRWLRTSLGIFFADDATVGAANALLARLGAEIVMMVAGPPYVVVRIPDPGTLDALRALAAEIEADPAVATVSLDSIPESAILPPKFPLPTQELQGDARRLYEERLGYIDHLLTARAPSAWNARAAVVTAPTLVMADAFGEGVPGAEIAAAYPAPDEFAVGRPDLAEDGFPVRHGYQVLGVIAAAFDGEGGPANCFAQDAVPGPATTGCAVGIYPEGRRSGRSGTPRVRVADMRKLSWLPLEAHILFAVKELAPNKVVVNASIARLEVITGVLSAQDEGQRWTDLVQRSGLEERFLLVTVSGNVDPRNQSVRTAEKNSSFTAAALHKDIPIDKRLQNILVVENRKDSRFPFRPGGLNETSKTGGHISATGTNVWTVVPPRAGQTGWTGTSLAAPQVAGVAAYVWSIAPELSVEQVRKLILDHAVPGQPKTLDAYATIVGIDAVIGDYRVRRALLDFAPAAGGGTPVVNSEDVLPFFTNLDLPADQRRYDMGDLRAARDQTDPPRFDLNRDGRFEVISATVGARQVRFDETMLQFDADVMCYAAFEGPYETDTRVSPGQERCCDFFKQAGRFPDRESCFDCPARRRVASLPAADEEPKPVGIWRLSPPSGLVFLEFFFLEDGTVMIPAQSGLWEKGGTWTSTAREVDGEIFYDVRIDPCTDAIRHTRYAFEGTWSPRPVTDCFGVESCVVGDGCPAMKGMLTTTDGITTSPPGAVDSQRHPAFGIDVGWEPLNPPFLNQCHGGCFEEWRRTGLLACSPVGGHCLETTAPACGGACGPGSTCTNQGGSCSCVVDGP